MDATTVLYEIEPSAQPPPDQLFIFQQSGADNMIVVLHVRERLHRSLADASSQALCDAHYM